MTTNLPIISSFFGKKEVPIYKGLFTLELEGSIIFFEGKMQMAFGNGNFLQLEGKAETPETERIFFAQERETTIVRTD